MTLSIDILFAVYFFLLWIARMKNNWFIPTYTVEKEKKEWTKKNLAESIYAALKKLDWVEYLIAEGNEK